MLARLLAHPCRHVFNYEELPIMFQCVGYFGIHHCFFHLGEFVEAFVYVC